MSLRLLTLIHGETYETYSADVACKCLGDGTYKSRESCIRSKRTTYPSLKKIVTTDEPESVKLISRAARKVKKYKMLE